MKRLISLLLAALTLVAMLAVPALAEDPVKLIWIIGGAEATDHAMVWEKLNEMSARDIGITIDYKTYDGEKAQLATTTGEPCDIMFTCEWYNNYAVRASEGYFADLTELLPQHAPELYDYIPELIWKGAKIDGKIYAVPTYKDTAATQYIMVDKKYVDELNIDVAAIDTPAKVGDVAQVIKAAHPDIYPITVWRNGLGTVLDCNFDMVNREVMIGIPYSETSNTVYSLYEHPEYLATLHMLRDWYNKGFINPDAVTIMDEQAISYSAIRTAQGFPGADAIWSTTFKTPYVVNKIYGPVLSTSSIRGSMNAVMASSKNKEAAVKYLQYVNLNPEYRNMLRYGIEGVHYQLTDEGTVQISNDGYNGPWGFAQGTFFTLKVMAPSAPDSWELTKAQNDVATATESLGFSFDVTPVQDEVAACTAIIDKYRHGLFCGAVEVEPEIEKMMKELEGVGYREVLAEAQRQLDVFLGK